MVMTSVSNLSDPAHHLHPVKASARVATINAGDATAEQANNGLQIDRRSLPREFRSVLLSQPFRITQAAAKSVIVKIKGQHRSSTTGAGSTWADVTAALGGSTGSRTISSTGATDSVVSVGLPLAGCKRYVRQVVTPDFNATTTGPLLDLDAGVATFVGPDRTPAAG
jgi:hypothetical protein